MKKSMINNRAFVLVLLLFSLTGCDMLNPGLGPDVDMSPPVLSVSSPAYMENVSSNFTISGTVKDDTGVSVLIIEIENTSFAWRYSDAGWQYTTDKKSWSPATGTWQNRGGGEISWSVDIALPSSVTGEIVLKISTEDLSGNMGSVSVEKRTVVSDVTPPVVYVTYPELFTGTGAEADAHFASYQLEDITKISELFNGDFTIKGYQDENSRLDRLEVELADAGGTVYWQNTFTDSAALRNFTVNIPQSELASISGKTVLQLIIRSYDAAGNSDARSHGWFCYWPDADKPWLQLPGDSTNPPSVSVYPQQSLEGQAFDDDGLGAIDIYIEENVSGWQEVSHTAMDSTVLNGSSSYTWQVPAPQESGTYRLRATVSDINGLAGTEKISYFSVEDISSPRISVENPAQDMPMLGDSLADVTFSGYADDDSGVSELKIVWINPASYDTSLLSYLNKDYTGWNSSGSDANGNIVFDNVVLGSSVYDGNGRFKKSFSIDINLFSDLGISQTNPLVNQTFVLRAVDDNNKASTLKYVVKGDMTPPALNISTIKVKHSDLSIDSYSISDSLILPAFLPGDQISIEGNWSDNTTDIWADKSRIGDVNLTVDGTSLAVSRNPDGTWTSEYTPAPDKSIISLQASISDMGGNTTVDTRSVRIETNTPQLVRITSTNDNGRYASASNIDIVLEFNKSVSFTEGSNEPVIVLNNGASASYLSGNGSTRIIFRYTVSPGNDIALLDVSSINISAGNSFKDDTGTAVDLSQLPSGINSLAGSKNIAVDTTSPYITGFRVLSAKDAYKAGDTVVIAADLSEPVLVTASPSLSLSSGISASAVYTSNHGSYLRFSYIVAAGENANPLTVTSLISPGSITDAAGNPIDSSIPHALDRTIAVDTEPPAAPVINGLTDGATYYGTVNFNITATETGATVEYSTNNGGTWIQGSTGSIAVNGSYAVTARQTDVAGNTSAASTPVNITIDSGNLLTRISALTADGIYKEGDKIEIVLSFRKTLYINSTQKPALVLNTNPQRTASYKSGSGTDSFVFEYTVNPGDSVSTVLDVDSIDFNSAVIADSSTGSRDLSAYIDLSALSADDKLSGQRSIQLLTTAPQLVSCTLSGNTLELEFDRDIYKGSGNIVISQDTTGLKVPILLSPTQYAELASRAPSLAANYKLGTNGASDSGTPLLDAVYVLDFSLSPDDTTLVTAYTDADLHKITIPVSSSQVSVAGATLSINLTGSYALPVKGADYTVETEAGLVYDQVSHTSGAETAGTVSLPGVERPVIRVDRRSETLSAGAQAVVASQPLTASVKMDTITPGAQIYYNITEAVYSPEPVSDPNTPNQPPQPQAGPAEPPEPTSSSTAYTGSLTIGSAAGQLDGYKCWIKAIAVKGAASSQTANEVAYKSVVSFVDDAGGGAIPDYTGGPLYDSSNTLVVNDNSLPESMWIRGSDDIAGPPTVPGLPLSWDNYDYNGIRLMTRLSASPQQWYWVTWEIVSTTYIGLIWGTTPDTVAEAQKGPWRWGWHKNAYVPFRNYYPLFPGESRQLASSLYATIDGIFRGNYIFARPGDGVTFIRDYLHE